MDLLLAIWSSPLVEAATAIAYVCLAGAVTIDVLLKKGDVRAALGWIAAAWLSPIFGSLLYYMFGINRVTRRALRLRLDRRSRLPDPVQPDAAAHISELFKVSAQVTGGPLTAGNGLTILEGGDAAYPAMLAAIGQARDCIAMASYIFRNDAAGQAFADALAEAVRRGVKVRLLLDSVGIGYVFAPILSRLKRGGVPTARFLHTWLPWRMPFLNMRNHRKLLVVDGRLAFMGGMNVGAENCRSLVGDSAIGDVHFKVEGPAVRLVMDAFARDWTFTTEEELNEDCWWPELAPAGHVFARGLRSGPDADLYNLETILGAAFTLAKQRFRIVTPYFLPDARLQFAIAQACLRGVEVEIVIPQKGDVLLMDWAMRANLRFSRHIGAKIYATAPPFDHSKLATMDGQWCLIGSSNWDARSFRLNFEFDLECCEAALVRDLDALIDARIARGTRLNPKAMAADPVWIRLRDAAARLMMPYL